MKMKYFLILFVIFYGILNANTTRENVSGVWSDPTYIIENDIVLASGDTLIIEAGVEVLFDGEYKFEIMGSLIVLGSIDLLVHFEPVDTLVYWRGLRFLNNNPACDSSFINYAAISFAENAGGGGIEINSYDEIMISNSEIFNCNATMGGGIYVHYCSPTIVHSKIYNNSAGMEGGGIHAQYSNHIVLEDVHIYNNDSFVNAGGLSIRFCRSNVQNCIIEYNTSGTNGGGLLALNLYTGAEFRDCIIRNNSTGLRGGGYFSNDGNAYFYSTEIYNNNSNLGGGCYISNADTYFVDCLINHNTAEFGGAVYLSNSASQFMNCHFNFNHAEFGGAFYSTSNSAEVICNSNILWNQANYNGGGYLTVQDDGAYIINTILFYNETSAIPGNQIYIGSAGSETFFNNCVIQNGVAGISGYPEIMIPPLYENNFENDPEFIHQLLDFSLLDTSPCIDAGTVNLPEGLEIPEFDINGNQRIIGNEIDIGACEWQGTGIESDELPVLSCKLNNYPNPFNPSTTISFELNNETADNTELVIYNLKGQKVKTLDCSNFFAAASKKLTHSIVWNGTDQNNKPVSSGIYFVRLTSGKINIQHKMLLLK